MWIKLKIEEILRELMINGTIDNMREMFENTSSATADLQTLILQGPESYEGGVLWNVVNEASRIMTPIAALILTAVMCVELISVIERRNNMHTSTDSMWFIFVIIFKMAAGAILVEKSPVITAGIFQLGNYAVSKMSYGGSITTLHFDAAAVTATLETKGTGYLMGIFFTSMVGKITVYVIAVLIWLIVVGRLFRICIYCSVGAVPYATLMQKDISDIGKNFIKNLLALSFQGFFMFIIVAMHIALTNNVALSSDPNQAILGLLKNTGVFVFALFGTGNMAKSIFNAH